MRRLKRLIAGRRYRPDVVIFTRRWRHDSYALAWRAQRPVSVFYRRRSLRRQMGPREDRKPPRGQP
jgi:hypothetical protein